MAMKPSSAGGAPADRGDPLWPRCGAPIDWQPTTDLPLEISLMLPDEPLIEELPGGLARIDVRVTNVSDSALRATTGRAAHLTLVRDGLVVASPPGQRSSAHSFDLGPGASRDYKSGVSLRRCTPGPPSPDPAPLPAGTYQLYAAQSFSLGRNRHTQFVVQAGPWDLTIARTVRA